MLGAGFKLTHLQRAQNDVAYGKGSTFQKPHGSEASSSSNVERFLESVTPLVPAHYLSKTIVRERKGSEVDLQSPYFVLGDVWEAFAEWSAYGIGVPLTLNDNNKDPVFQYYVPSLSAIQVYANSDVLRSSLLQGRRLGEESESDFRDSSSEGSSSESEKGLSYPEQQLGARMDQLSLRKEEHQEDSSSDDGESLSSQGHLIFEYLEQDLPYVREPFADKMSDLASRFPELKTLRSCDLASSWFSVAWYPIYRIPTGPTLKDLDASFLTYHSLHTPSQGVGITTQSMGETQPRERVETMPMPVFGLAAYKLRGSVWTSRSGHQLVNSLFQAADSWLQLHQVNHPDFAFFCRRS